MAIKPSAIKILACLRDNRHRYVYAKELADLGSYDYRSRISELRRSGFVIVSRRVRGKACNEFRLILEAQEGAA